MRGFVGLAVPYGNSNSFSKLLSGEVLMIIEAGRHTWTGSVVGRNKTNFKMAFNTEYRFRFGQLPFLLMPEMLECL
jgi:hypothetical protein